MLNPRNCPGCSFGDTRLVSKWHSERGLRNLQFGSQEVRLDLDCSPMPSDEDMPEEDEENEEDEQPADGYR